MYRCVRAVAANLCVIPVWVPVKGRRWSLAERDSGTRLSVVAWRRTRNAAHSAKRRVAAAGKNIDVYNSIGHHGNAGGGVRNGLAGARLAAVMVAVAGGGGGRVNRRRRTLLVSAGHRSRGRWGVLRARWWWPATWWRTSAVRQNLSDSVILVNSFSSRIVTNSAHGGRAKLLAHSHAAASPCLYYIYIYFFFARATDVIYYIRSQRHTHTEREKGMWPYQ